MKTRGPLEKSPVQNEDVDLAVVFHIENHLTVRMTRIAAQVWSSLAKHWCKGFIENRHVLHLISLLQDLVIVVL